MEYAPDAGARLPTEAAGAQSDSARAGIIKVCSNQSNIVSLFIGVRGKDGIMFLSSRLARELGDLILDQVLKHPGINVELAVLDFLLQQLVKRSVTLSPVPLAP